jgi:hypothetical protein
MRQRTYEAAPHHDKQCRSLCRQFTFAPLQTAKPPRSKGVYIIRVLRRGKPTSAVIEGCIKAVAKLEWPMVEKKVTNRLQRLKRVSSCSVIYIGSAGTSEKSKHTLFGRYRDFTGRHTAMFPLWALLPSGWAFEYGWLEAPHPAEVEADLKERYRKLHKGSLPALVQR